MLAKDLMMPQRLQIDETTLTETYGRFIAEPFEKGYGHTIGNSLRRILLSSLGGAAATAVRIGKAQHEFQTLPGVREDVARILLNVKGLRFRLHTSGPEVLRLAVKREGPVQAKDLEPNANVQILNPTAPIATLDRGGELDLEMWITPGRGYVTAERQQRDGFPATAILLDALFSPVVKVHYEVETARVGQITDYDKLILEIWTDGVLHPADALARAAKILKDGLSIFITFEEKSEPSLEAVEQPLAALPSEEDRLKDLIAQPVEIIELSVRASNCLKAAKIYTIGELVRKTDSELVAYKNFGKKSLEEIKERLKELGLHLGMQNLSVGS
ncbi:MAG: DNA-directed RNA polymerase subunit alpha [Elusimicrobia bacterium]|nr:DNA-directed RNA polymerase subunit alpha [Elusimicrobiota bacterium]